MKRYHIRQGILLLLLTGSVLLTGCADYVNDGAELLKEEKYEEAGEQFQKAIKKETNLGEAYRGLGICYWEQEEYEKSAEALQNALENGAEKTAAIYNLLGLCALKQENSRNAAIYFQKGMTQEDASEELLREMAYNEICAYEMAKDYASAKLKLQTYVANYPDDEKASKELQFLETQMPQ